MMLYYNFGQFASSRIKRKPVRPKMMDKTSHYRDLSSPYKGICSLSNTHLSSIISHDQTPAPLRPASPRAVRD